MKHPRSDELLVGQNAARADVDQPWEQDNQAWWDWYVSLADNPDPSRPLRDLPPEPSAAADGARSRVEVVKELGRPFALSAEDQRRFQREGFVKLRGVLSADACRLLRGRMQSALERAFRVRLDGGVTGRFLSLELLWLEDPLLRAFVLSPRIAEISARLLGVPAVRLYHDNVLSKEPGCGRTPWHYDDHHFPLDTQDVVTAWIPAQAIPEDMGPLAFAADMNAFQWVKDVPFSKTDTSYDRQVSAIFREREVELREDGFELGEVSFHHNLSFHTAGPNQTRRSRIALANTYFADGGRVVKNPTMVSGDWEKFMPGVAPGEVVDSPRNPVCWRNESS